jgi:2,4-dienoyl-CoA reductase-like NADH-dependent reductase (Old Yellow Enzyme family)
MGVRPDDPWVLGDVVVPNRLVRSATAEGMAGPRGEVTPELLQLYGRLGRGGAGLVITGGAFVHPSGRGYPGVTGADSDSLLPGLSQLATAIASGGARPLLQLYHCGRQAFDGGPDGLPWAPSPLTGEFSRVKPREMTTADIDSVVQAFAAAARRASRAGFPGVEILASNGYLLHEFLSPATNRRGDAWGGGVDGRFRLLGEVVRAVRGAVGAGYPLLVKLCVHDHVRSGMRTKEGLEFARRLEALGVDGIEPAAGLDRGSFWGLRGDLPVELLMESKLISVRGPQGRRAAGFLMGRMRRRVRFRQGYLLDFAAAAKGAGVRVPLLLGGGVREMGFIRRVLDGGWAESVCMARPLIREPELPSRLLDGTSAGSGCRNCNRCLIRVLDGNPLRCYALA